METFSGGVEDSFMGSQPVPFGRTVAPGHWRHIAMTSHSSAPKPWFTSSVWIARLCCKSYDNWNKKPTKITWKKGQMLKTNRTTPPPYLKNFKKKTWFWRTNLLMLWWNQSSGVVWGGQHGDFGNQLDGFSYIKKQYLRYICQDSNQPIQISSLQ